MRSRCRRSIMTMSASFSPDFMSWNTSTPISSIPAGISVDGPTTRTRAPSALSAMMLERATRECRMSPQIATVSPSMRPQIAADGQRVEQRLGRMFVRAVAGVDDGAIDLARQQMHGAGLMVAHDDDVGPHGVEGDRGVDQRLALLHAGIADRHVHHVGAEALAGEFERGLRAGRGLEEQIDQRAAAQGGRLLLDLRAKCRRRRRRDRAGSRSRAGVRPSMPSRWRRAKISAGMGWLLGRRGGLSTRRYPRRNPRAGKIRRPLLKRSAEYGSYLN